MPSGNKPLHELMLTQFYVVILRHEAKMDWYIEVSTKWPTICRRHFKKAFYWKKTFRILITISPKFAPDDPIDNTTALVQVMAWHWICKKALTEPMMIIHGAILRQRPLWRQITGVSVYHLPAVSRVYLYHDQRSCHEQRNTRDIDVTLVTPATQIGPDRFISQEKPSFVARLSNQETFACRKEIVC